MKKIYSFLLVLIAFSMSVNAQQVTITDDGSYTPNASALLDIHAQSGDMGMLIPQVSLTGVAIKLLFLVQQMD